MGEFRMPSLGADMDAGTLTEWLKHPGDEVERGDIIAVVETQKGAIEVEVFESGTIDELLVEEGATVPVGTPLAQIRAPGEAPAETAAEAPGEAQAPARERKPEEPARPKSEPHLAAAPAVQPAVAPPPKGAEGRFPASPAARKLAAERGVDLSGIDGSGPDGAILRGDVESAAAGAASSGTEAEKKKAKPGLDLAEMRKAIAAAMARSKREIPHYYISQAIDLTPALDRVEALNADRAPTERVLPAVLLLKAVAKALAKYPEFNGFYEEDGFRHAEAVNLGVAVAIRGGGLVAPAIFDADRKDIGTLMTELRELVANTRAGRLRSSQLSAATITVSSLGDRGADALFGVIYPPQVALVGFGAPARRPWCVDDEIVPRQVVTASLAADHRASDGHRGALFLAEIDKLLQEPENL